MTPGRTALAATVVLALAACNGGSRRGPGGGGSGGGGGGGGGVTPCADSSECDDGVSCTIDECLNRTCVHEADSAACGDGSWCDARSGCVAGTACATVEDCEAPDTCLQPSRCVSATGTCEFALLDSDEDGVPPPVCGGDDCDDSDRYVTPGRWDGCGFGDEDCDGAIDEDANCPEGEVCISEGEGYCTPR